MARPSLKPRSGGQRSRWEPKWPPARAHGDVEAVDDLRGGGGGDAGGGAAQDGEHAAALVLAGGADDDLGLAVAGDVEDRDGFAEVVAGGVLRGPQVGAGAGPPHDAVAGVGLAGVAVHGHQLGDGGEVVTRRPVRRVGVARRA